MSEILFSSFSLVAISEMGDKTQLLAFSLAARYRKPIPILGGILLATLANHGLAAYIGDSIAAHFETKTLGLVLGISFIAFAIWTLKPDTVDEGEPKKNFGPFLTTTALFFLAEMGDKTQLATVALAARYHAVLLVTAGTTLGMMLSDGLAVFLGDRIAGHVQMRWVRIFAAILFLFFGIVTLIEVYR